MTGPTRREFFAATGAIGAAAMLAACNTAPGGKATQSKNGPLTWWDHTPNLQAANKRNFKAFQKKTGRAVEYTQHQTAKMGQALQLAKQSNQRPDVHSLAGLGKTPTSKLIADGWFRPWDIGEEALARLPKGALVDGVHVFGGKPYTVPFFNDRQYWTATWYNKDMLEKAGAEPPTTYDSFRTAARKIQKSEGGDTYGWIFNLNQPDRLVEHMGYLAQGAGFPGSHGSGSQGGTLFRTGEITYHHDAYVDALEFLLSLKKDGLLFPGSSTLDDNTGRVKWAAGAAGFFIDGPWCPGTLSGDAPQFLEKLDVAPLLVPETGMPVQVHRPVQGGMYWLNKQTQKADDANVLLAGLTTQQYYVDIANGMAQPPLDISAIDKADVHPAWKKLVGWFQEQAFYAPMPMRKNPEIDKVWAQDGGIDPDLGQVIQGLFSGDLSNPRKELKSLSDRASKNREKCLAKAKKKGAKVELDDFAFPDWEPGKDYTADMYKKA
ncbi:extracellular solute-binding protein [Streptomyces sp. A7024]|uniref:Extracellular solute-binding protein n=1 Tax=Streptomyces coryli TaxID=1128680 RepID=A0A6G4TT84_9ACTN|nr:extracellular solute-binding protein [Streptomyces coryli]NGN62750.1 extracellular solute-binding protein [Streptomyces coryli]